MRRLRPTTLALLVWPGLALLGHGLARAASGAGCEQQFVQHPDDPEAAQCFWQEAKQRGNRGEMARQVRRLLAMDPQNLGLQLYSVVLEPPLPDRAEIVMRSVAANFSHHAAVGEILARDNLINLLIRQGRYDEAGREVQREMAVAQALPASSHSKYLALTRITEAFLLSVRGDYQHAGLLLDEVTQGPLRDERWLVVATRVHQETGQLGRSWSECVQLSQPTYSHYARAWGLYCQAQVLVERAAELPAGADTIRIERMLRDAIREAETGGNTRVAASAHFLLARLAKGSEQAQAEIRQCLDLATEDDLKGMCRAALDRFQALAGKAAAAEGNGMNRGGELMDPLSRARVLGDQMRVSWKARPLDDFVHDAQDALAQIERLRVQQTDPVIQSGLFSTWSDDYYWFSGRLLDPALAERCPSCIDRAFEVVERLRARALRDVLVAAESRGTAAETDAQRLAALDQAIERVTQRRRETALPPGERANAASDLAAFTAEKDLLRRHSAAPRGAPGGGSGASARTGGGTAQPRAFATLSQVQQLLEPGEALLSFQIAPWRDWTGDFGGGSWLVVVTRTARRSYRLEEMGREALRRAVADFLAHRARSQPWQASELFDRLLAPALAALPPGIKRLIIVPDDHLHRLPFAALRARPDAAPIVWHYQISIVPSATLWARWRAMRRQSPAERPALVLADPPPPTPAVQRTFEAGGITLPPKPLPGARREADALVRFLGWGCERRVGSAVSAAALLDSRAALPSFALVHFAAHSIVDDRDPRRSGIWLSPSPGHDGLVRAAEIARLAFDDRLVVLATCSSNGGPFLSGEGVMSLAHAFFEARARTVVASLWPQLDTDAEALVTSFYRHLGSGASVAAALRLAQLDRLRQYPHLPPVAWAGMVVLGDGELVPFPGGRHPWPWWWPIVAAAAAALLALLAFSCSGPAAPGSVGPARTSSRKRRPSGSSPAGDLALDLGQELGRGGDQAGEERFGAVEARFLGAAGDDASAGGQDQGDAGGDVPFVLRHQGPGGVGEAGGHARQLVGHRAHGDHLEGGAGEALPLAAVNLRAAGQDLGTREARAGAEADRGAVEGHALPAGAEKGLAARRVADAAGDRLAVFDQAHRDRPLGQAGHELPRAVERVDHPHPAAAEAGAVVVGLLREPPLAGARQRLPQQRVDQGVGLGDRIAAALGAGLDLAGGKPGERPRRSRERVGDARQVFAVIQGGCAQSASMLVRWRWGGPSWKLAPR